MLYSLDGVQDMTDDRLCCSVKQSRRDAIPEKSYFTDIRAISYSVFTPIWRYTAIYSHCYPFLSITKVALPHTPAQLCHEP